MAVGLSIAAKINKQEHKIVCLISDGECDEGSNWEAFLSAAHYQLDNLYAILDYNQQQITGAVQEVMDTGSISEKLRAFGWAVREVDGHDLKELEVALNNGPLEVGKPSFIIAHTIKGKGISFMERVLKWHHGVPSPEQYKQAQKELDQAGALI